MLAAVSFTETAALADHSGQFPTAAYQAAASADMLGIAIPTKYGGLGVSAVAQATVIEALAGGCAAVVGAVIGNGIQAALTILYGISDSARQRVLPSLLRGEQQVAFAITETSAGSDAAALGCRATQIDGGWQLVGEKVMINRASLSSSAIVFATVDPALSHRGITAYLVNLHQKGISIGAPLDKMGQRGLPTESIRLEEAFVPVADQLSDVGQGFALMMKVINRARTMVAANAVGRMSKALDVAVAHIKTREQFGAPLAMLDAVRAEIADMAVAVETGRCLTQLAAGAIDRASPDQVLYAAMAKLRATDACIDVCRGSMLICGGMAYTNAFPLERMLRDAMAGQIVDGANPVQKQVIAKEIFKSLKAGG